MSRDSEPTTEYVRPGKRGRSEHSRSIQVFDERRRTPRGRRERDRLFQHDTSRTAWLAGKRELCNLLLLVDDDLREAVLALGAVETYLCRARAALDTERPDRRALEGLSADGEVVTRLDVLVETLLALRKRLGLIGESLP